MEITHINSEKNIVRVNTDSNEESLFLLLKTYLEKDKEVDIVGVYKEHHLINKTEFLLKTKKGDAKEYLKKRIKEITKDLEKLKIK